jgi:glycosyltransferase involved in cell wall biosynthesis
MKNVFKTIVFPLIATFPTRRAYGITTEVYITTPRKGDQELTKVSLVEICRNIHSFLLTGKLKNFVGLRLKIFTIWYGLNISSKFRKELTLFWCRDLFLSYILSVTSRLFIICEIHRRPSKFDLLILLLLKKNQRVLLAPISIKLQKDLNLDKNLSVVVPMSVSEDDIKFLSKPHHTKKNKIIYVGNLMSGGHKLNVNLLNELGYRLRSTFPDWKIEVVGISKSEFNASCKRKVCSNVKVINRLNRQEILGKLAEAKIGLVIYSDEKYFHDSFPIKIVEYAAARLCIVASNTISHRNILNNDLCVYFESGSIDSLENSVVKLILDQKRQHYISKNIFLWVQGLTYENRVKLVLDKFQTQIYCR